MEKEDRIELVPPIEIKFPGLCLFISGITAGLLIATAIFYLIN